MPYPYGEARLLHLGGLSQLLGRPEAARERLEAARVMFQRLGARMNARKAELVLGAP
jgi:hypothetical protein